MKTAILFLGVIFMVSNMIYGQVTHDKKIYKIFASSTEKNDTNLQPEKAIDGDRSTRWSSEFKAPQWITIDLGQKTSVAGVVLVWENAAAAEYTISKSTDNSNWVVIYRTTKGKAGKKKITFNPITMQYIKIDCLKRVIDWAGFSLFEIDVLNEKGVSILHPETEEFGVLRNQSFENGEEEWQKNGNAAHIGIYNWQVNTGKLSMGIGNDKGPDNAYGEISQKIDVPGKINKDDLFIFSCYFKGENRYTGKASTKVDFYNSENKLLKSFQSKILNGAFPWTKSSVIGKAPANASYIIVKCLSENMKYGKGSSYIWIDNGNLICPIISASSYSDDKHLPQNVMSEGEWQSSTTTYDTQYIMINLRKPYKISGLSINWTNNYPKRYKVSGSNNANEWALFYAAEKNKTGIDKIYIGETICQYIKIVAEHFDRKKGIGIENIDFMKQSELVTIKTYPVILAEQSPGCFPRWLLQKEAWWTDVGVEGDFNEAIMCEDGTIEPHKRGFSIIPFIYHNGKLITRNSATVTQSLENKYLPIPSVKWSYKNIEMNVKLFAFGKRGKSIAYVIYRIKNKSNSKAAGKLFLSIRPYQIFPPWQDGGGFSPITNIQYSKNIITVNNKYKIFPLSKNGNFGSRNGSKYFKFPFKTPAPPELKGDITALLKKGIVPKEKNISDSNGLLSSVLEYKYELNPHESVEYYLAIPLHKKSPDIKISMTGKKVRNEIHSLLNKSISYWESRTNNFKINIPETNLVNMLKSSICYNLITKDGAGFQPGARSYDKVWIRDGGMAACAMLKMGLTTEVREFIDWYAGYQYDSGLVPPIIDNKAKDPLWEEKPPHNLIEYDCQGEFIFTILQYYHFTKDLDFLKDKFDNVKRAFEYQVYLRKQTKTDEYKDPKSDKHKYYGILPRSTSHEGYWREFSYWDDFWGLKGCKDARTIFTILGKTDLAKRADIEYKDFKKCFYQSATETMRFFNLDFFPASASLGDIDPTSTAVSVMYCDELNNMPPKPLQRTFDLYYKDLSSRFKKNAKYRFTPYELRDVPAFLFMGQKERALELIRFMVTCRRPLNWNQLAEVVNSDYRYPEYVGDIPHTWVASEYINGFRSLFVYEKEDELILAHGIDEKWLDRKEGISVENMPTYYGKISYSMKKQGNQLLISISGTAKLKKGFIFKSPFLHKKISGVTINNKKINNFSDNEFRIMSLPAEVVVSYEK